jgi:uncharacterized coiled-coil protein SlyX
VSLVNLAGQYRTSTKQSQMIEQVIPVTIAVITGGAVMMNRIHGKIHNLDRRIDTVELRMAEAYVSKGDFNRALTRMEDHLIRIEEKMDQLVNKSCP